MFSGLSWTSADIFWNWYQSWQLETDGAGSHNPGIEGVGRPGCVECGLLSNFERYPSGWHVSQVWSWWLTKIFVFDLYQEQQVRKTVCSNQTERGFSILHLVQVHRKKIKMEPSTHVRESGLWKCRMFTTCKVHHRTLHVWQQRTLDCLFLEG